MLLSTGLFPESDVWYYVAVTYDGEEMEVFLNGEFTTADLDYPFCGGHEGSLVIGQEQDALGGGFDVSQNTPMLLHAMAIHNQALDSSKITASKKRPNSGTGDASLHALWVNSGVDETGNGNAATVVSNSSTSALSFVAAAKSNDLTAEICAQLCADYSFFGLQNGDACLCGDNVNGHVEVGASECEMLCTGAGGNNDDDDDEGKSAPCGGFRELSIYKVEEEVISTRSPMQGQQVFMFDERFYLETTETVPTHGDLIHLVNLVNPTHIRKQWRMRRRP